jgi:dihydrofolate synthase/folylpolyglutamate synthase
MDRLGHTIAAIAGEKGGIIKESVPVVIGARDSDARLVLTSIASQRHSPAFMIDREFSYRSHAPAHRLDYHGLGLTLEGVDLTLAGPFQHENAAIALAATDAMRADGWNLPEDAIRRGLREMSWPGRFDIVMREPLVILDCAHNELAIEALLETIAVELGTEVKPRLVFGCLEDKQWERMAAMLGPRVSEVTITRAAAKRPLDPTILQPVFSTYAPTRIVRDPQDAIAESVARAGRGDVVLVTGSVYLVGEVYPWFLSRQGRRGLFPEAAA